MTKREMTKREMTRKLLGTFGLAAALLFRSEAAVSAASGILVVFGFLGNLFVREINRRLKQRGGPDQFATCLVVRKTTG